MMRPTSGDRRDELTAWVQAVRSAVVWAEMKRDVNQCQMIIVHDRLARFGAHLALPRDGPHEVAPQLWRQQVPLFALVLLKVDRHVHRGVAPSDSDETEDDLFDRLLGGEHALRTRVRVQGQDSVDVCERVGRGLGMARDRDVGEKREFERLGGWGGT